MRGLGGKPSHTLGRGKSDCAVNWGREQQQVYGPLSGFLKNVIGGTLSLVVKCEYAHNLHFSSHIACYNSSIFKNTTPFQPAAFLWGQINKVDK